MGRVRVDTLIGLGTTATPAAVPTCAMTTSGTGVTWGSNPGLPTIASGDHLEITAEPDTPKCEIIWINGPYTAGSTTASGVTRNAEPTQNGQNNSNEHTSVGWTHGPTTLDFAVPNIVTKSAAYTAEINDLVLVTAGSGANFGITAPAPVVNGVFGIKKVDTGSAVVTPLPHAAETFDGAANGRPLTLQNDIVYYISDGTSWWALYLVLANAQFESAAEQMRLDQFLAAGGSPNFGGFPGGNMGSGVVATDSVRKDDAGWIQDTNVWTTVGSPSWEFSVPTNTSLYSVGMCVKWQESGSQKYGVIASSTPGSTTDVFLANTTDFKLVAANPDVGTTFYSYGVPRDVPAQFTWSSAGSTGLSGTINFAVANFSIKPGRRILINLQATGSTSTGTTFTITNLPITSASGNSSIAGGVFLDNSAVVAASGVATIGSATTTMILGKMSALGNSPSLWVATGARGVITQIEYGI